MSQSATGHPEDRDPEDRPLRRSLLLIGLMGVGKTTIARVLARRLKTRMIDTDTEIERRARSTVAQIFAEQGEEQFRLMETDLLRHLDRRRHVRIVSTGGGLPLRPENQALLRRIGDGHLAAGAAGDDRAARPRALVATASAGGPWRRSARAHRPVNSRAGIRV